MLLIRATIDMAGRRTIAGQRDVGGAVTFAFTPRLHPTTFVKPRSAALTHTLIAKFFIEGLRRFPAALWAGPRSQAVLAVMNGAVIGNTIVGIKLRPKFDFAVNLVVDNGQAAHLQRGSDYSPALTFAHSENGSLSDRPASGFQLLVLVLVLFLTADEAFVQFHDAAQLRQVRPSARFPQAVKHEPCRLLRDADFFRQLQRRDAFAGGDEQVHGIEPLVQRNVRPLKDGASSDGEVQFARVAAIETALARRDVLRAFAGRAERPVSPDARFQKEPRRLGIGKHLENLKRAYGAFAHALSVDNSLAFVKGIKYVTPFAKEVRCRFTLTATLPLMVGCLCHT